MDDVRLDHITEAAVELGGQALWDWLDGNLNNMASGYFYTAARQVIEALQKAGWTLTPGENSTGLALGKLEP